MISIPLTCNNYFHEPLIGLLNIKLNYRSKYDYTLNNWLSQPLVSCSIWISTVFFTIKLKTKADTAYRIPSHQIAIGHNLNQVDDDNDWVQNVSNKHILVQCHPMACKVPGRKTI